MMKKNLLFTLAAALVLGMAACKKDASDKDYLVKTTWVAVDGTETDTLEFKTASAGTYTYEDTEFPEENFSMDFTYTYDPPTVTITLPGVGVKTGTVSGNTIVSEGTVFTKK